MKLKKIIAREGLVILGIIGISCFVYFISSPYPRTPKPINYYGNLTASEKNSIKELMKLREKFPEYNDLNNLILSEKLAEKFPEYTQIYKDMNANNYQEKGNQRLSAQKICDKNGRPFSNIRKSFYTALKKSGIINFRLHDCRHTFASHLVMSGVDLNTVRELLGHKSIEMTLRYAHLSPDHKRRAVDILGSHMDTIWTPEVEDRALIEKAIFLTH